MTESPPQRCAVIVALGVGDERQGSGAEVLVDGLTRHHGWGPATEVAEWYSVSPELRDGLLQPRDLSGLGATGPPAVLETGHPCVAGLTLPDGWVAGLRRWLAFGPRSHAVLSVALRYPSRQDALRAAGAPGSIAWSVRHVYGSVLCLIRVRPGVGAPPSDEFLEALQGRLERSEEGAQRVSRFSVRRPGDLPDVDLYEFFWADASRFPAALRSFLAAFAGLLVSVVAAGRAALVGGQPLGPEPATPPPRGLLRAIRRPDRGALAAVEWLLAVAVPVVCLTLLALAGVLGVALALNDARSWVRVAAVVASGLVLVEIGRRVLRRYARNARSSAWPVGLLAAAAAVGTACWRAVEQRNSVRGLGDTLAFGVAYPFRAVWLLVTAAVLVGAISALALSIGPARPRRRCGLTALLALAIAPLGVSALLALSTAALGGTLQPVAEDVTFFPAGTAESGDPPACIAGHSEWTRPDAKDCRLRQSEGFTAWTWGARLYGQTVAPLLYVGVIGLGAVIALLGLTALYTWRAGALVGGPAGQARRLTAALAAIERFAPGVLSLALVAASYAVFACWLPGLWLPWRSSLLDNSTAVASGAAILGGLTTLLIFTARRVGWTPGALVGGGVAKEILRTVLDRAYDISTFLREPPPRPRFDDPAHFPKGRSRPSPRAPRERILQRYRALTRHVAAGGASPAGPYDRVVFVAHSQGTALTATLLAEPQPGLPRDVRLLTFGSPLRQLYAARLPDQFRWVSESGTSLGSHLPTVAEWWNVASPGDFVGRTIAFPPPVDWPAQVHRRIDTTPKELLLPRGRHSVYWKDAELYDLLDRMITGDDAAEPAA